MRKSTGRCVLSFAILMSCMTAHNATAQATAEIAPSAQGSPGIVKPSEGAPIGAHIVGARAVTLPPAPKSAWMEKDKAQFTKLLAGKKADIFIAPIQVHGLGLDRSTRSLMAADLTAALSAGNVSPPLNSFLLQRALGEGLRKIDLAEITRMADAAGARKCLVVSAGHDRSANLKIQLQWTDRAPGTTFWPPLQKRELTFPISADDTAADVFRAKAVPEIQAQLGLTLANAPAQVKAAKLAAFPNDIGRAFEVAAQGPLNESMIYQLMGTLAPARPERARERLYEQSLLAMRQLDRADSTVRLLSARATFYLHSRPAALAILGKPTNAAETAFIAYMNGNLPEMEKAVVTVGNEILRLMLELELQDLRRTYRLPIKDKVPAYVVAMLEKRPDWQPLVERRLQDLDPWSVQSNVQLKLLLDSTMPVAGFDLESMVRGLSTLNKEIDEDELGMSTLEHIRLLRDSVPEIRQCAPGKVSCAKLAYLDLLEAVVIFNAVQRIEKTSILQGSYESAERVGTSIEKFLDGNAEFALSMSRAIFAGAQRAAPERRKALMDRQTQYALLATFWEQGQSSTAEAALVQLGVPSPHSDPYLAEYGNDIPVRDYWFPEFNKSPSELLTGMRTKLRHSASNVDVAIAIASRLSEPEKEALKIELANRFVGHPRRSAIFPTTAVQTTGIDSRLTAFETAKRERPDNWDNYLQYGKYLIESKGAYQESKSVFLQFPGFKDRRGYNSVALSNYAYEAGSLLFWRGAIAEAVPLYKISADLKTGSAAGMSSEVRLNLLEGKYEAAAAGSLERGARYDDPYAYRDYLAWLFAFGKTREAWSGFDQLQSRQKNPQVWLAAHVGQRIEQRSWPEIRAWLLSDVIRTTVIGGAKPALAEAVMLNVVDRMPADDFHEVMKGIEGEPLAKYDPPEVNIPHPLGEGWAGVRKSGINPNRDPETKSGKLASHLVMFADAYASLVRRDYEGASSKFYKMTSFYPIEGVSFDPNYSYALVYFARASAKSGDKYKLEAFLDKRQVIYFERFDNYLGKAVFSGLRGDASAAISDLVLAFNHRPHTERRPIFTEYQWAETCEWLFEETGNVRYRDLALEWAKVHQKLQPMYAWAYAMEAKLTTSEPDRLRALGMALYLDPLSDRARTFPESTKAKARKLFVASNPFRKSKERLPTKAKVTANEATRLRQEQMVF